MARVRKPQPTLESIFFNSPEQKVARFLLSEPTTTFTSRVISSKLKGVRGLGGGEGIMRILHELESIGFVEFVDNQRAVRVRDDNPIVQLLKRFTAVCDMEGFKALLAPLSTQGILFGVRAEGTARSDSNYDLLVVTNRPEEVRNVTERHPMGRKIDLVAVTSDEYSSIERDRSDIGQKMAHQIVLWGSSW